MVKNQLEIQGSTFKKHFFFWEGPLTLSQNALYFEYLGTFEFISDS